MSFIAGTIFLDAPASSLNNSNTPISGSNENGNSVKHIRVANVGNFPYVSAQSFRYWLRATLEADETWKANTAPIFRDTKVAYTDGVPMTYWDDDLLGYMRAPSNKTSAKEAREADQSRGKETPLTEKVTITRTSPFRMSTLVSIGPVNLVEDFGTMSRHDGNPVPHAHQFYRATLKGLFSLDLNRAGTFSYRDQSGSRNLDKIRIELAEQQGLEHDEKNKEYRLPVADRAERISHLLSGLSRLEGGAKQAIHYTDVTPAIIMATVLKGGNNPLHYVIVPDEKGRPSVHEAALEEAVRVWGDSMIGKLYVGWVKGFHDDQRAKLETKLKSLESEGLLEFVLDHPRVVLEQLANDVKNPAYAHWLD
jgi:CRISPR-associated protein Cst2